jgi:hypothetical protein
MTVSPPTASGPRPTTNQAFSLNVSIYLQSTRFSTPKHDTPFYTDGSIVLDALFLVLLSSQV